MKRDMDLARQVLLKVEESPTFDRPITLNIEGYSPEDISYNVLQLNEEEFLVAKSPGGGKWFPIRLTPKGHRFLDDCKGEEKWSKIKVAASNLGLTTLGAIATKLAEAGLRGFGIS